MLNEKIKLLEEVVSKALCDIDNIPMLSDSDYDDIFTPEFDTVYTEQFYVDQEEEIDFSPETCAVEWGYGSVKEMVVNFPDCAEHYGGQKWANTNTTMVYDGVEYEIWEGFVGSGSWVKNGFYGLVDPKNKPSIFKNSMQNNIYNRYCPFYAIAQYDGDNIEIYITCEGDEYAERKYITVYVE